MVDGSDDEHVAVRIVSEARDPGCWLQVNFDGSNVGVFSDFGLRIVLMLSSYRNTLASLFVIDVISIDGCATSGTLMLISLK